MWLGLAWLGVWNGSELLELAWLGSRWLGLAWICVDCLWAPGTAAEFAGPPQSNPLTTSARTPQCVHIDWGIFKV